MYAIRPSDDATISCGSGPDGTFPTTLSVAGSTTDMVRSDFASTNSDAELVGCRLCTACNESVATANGTPRTSESFFKVMASYRGEQPQEHEKQGKSAFKPQTIMRPR